MTGPQPAVFLDRDGVINVDRADYVKCWREFRFLPGVRQALARLRQGGLPVVVITNQSAVARGLISLEGLAGIHRNLSRAVERQGGRIEEIYFCPHHPDDRCACRKPRDGLLRQAAAAGQIALGKSVMIGDSGKDLEAGRKAGCRTVLVLTGQGLETLKALFSGKLSCPPDFICRDLAAAVDLLLAGGRAE